MTKARLVLNEDTMTLVNLEGFSVINKQYGDVGNGTKGYRVTAHFVQNGSLAVLATYTEEEHALECLKHPIHYILTGEDVRQEGEKKDVFVVRSILKKTNIIVPNKEEASKVVEIKR